MGSMYLLYVAISDHDSFQPGDRIVAEINNASTPIPIPGIGDRVEADGYTLTVHHRTFAYGISHRVERYGEHEIQDKQMVIGSVTLLCHLVSYEPPYGTAPRETHSP